MGSHGTVLIVVNQMVLVTSRGIEKGLYGVPENTFLDFAILS